MARSELSPAGRKLARVYLGLRWGMVGLVWLSVGVPSLLILRMEISRLLEFFTWAGLKYSLLYSPLAAMGVSICLGFTLTALLWQSQHELFGFSERTQRSLERQAERIGQLDRSHWLRRWLESPPENRNS
ncbi:MAG: hypothetical protein AAFY15_00795 [Cyanobacteria bacterium J06648_11]